MNVEKLERCSWQDKVIQKRVLTWSSKQSKFLTDFLENVGKCQNQK